MVVVVRRVRRGGGFTLVELLVVIAIVGMLVAILVPALARSRSRAREVACSSNLRQLGIICHAYASEWNNFFPLEPTEHNPHPGLLALAAQQGITEKIFYCPEAVAMESSAQDASYTPAGDRDSVIYTPTNLAAGNISYVFWSFQANKAYNGVTWREATFAPRWLRTTEPLRISGTLQPASAAERWMVADFFRQGAPFPHTRKHATGVNVMYMDGHADLVTSRPRTAFR